MNIIISNNSSIPIYEQKMCIRDRNYGTIATGNISNIDKIAPNVSYSTNPSTGVASEVTIYILSLIHI